MERLAEKLINYSWGAKNIPHFFTHPKIEEDRFRIEEFSECCFYRLIPSHPYYTPFPRFWASSHELRVIKSGTIFFHFLYLIYLLITYMTTRKKVHLAHFELQVIFDYFCKI